MYKGNPELNSVGIPYGKRGRRPMPKDVTKELQGKILDLISQGNSLRKIGDLPGMPAMSRIFQWLREDKAFEKSYHEADANRAEARLEHMMLLEDKCIDEINTVDPRRCSALAMAYKMKMDNIKWFASKIKAKKYGDKLDVTSADEKLSNSISFVVSPVAANAISKAIHDR